MASLAFFRGTCSNEIPGYLNDFEKFAQKGVSAIYFVAVNDVFVTGAWKEKLGVSDDSKVHVLADDAGKFSAAIGMSFDASGFLGNYRSHSDLLKFLSGMSS